MSKYRKRKLSLEEYKKEEEAFINKYSEYCDKLCNINRTENELIKAGELTPEQEELFENQRKELKEEYKGYDSIYYTDFYTIMDLTNLDQFIAPTEDNYKGFKRDLKKYMGKLVKPEYGRKYHGICKGIAVTIDDYYWLIDTGNEVIWFTCVGGISFYTRQDRVNDRGWYIVTNEKGYL